MRVLLDECVPRRLKRDLPGHEYADGTGMGWASKRNGDLLRVAEHEFDVFVTVNQKLQDQQNLAAFNIAVIVLAAPNNTLAELSALIPKVLESLPTAKPLPPNN